MKENTLALQATLVDSLVVTLEGQIVRSPVHYQLVMKEIMCAKQQCIIVVKNARLMQSI
jgi:hypothetical protein